VVAGEVGDRVAQLTDDEGRLFTRSGALPARPEGYRESDVWPETGPRDTERVVTGGSGEVWYSPDHCGTSRSWPW
jgi:guanyl-specific ribonuclease Sa